MLIAAGRSTDAHDKKHHPLDHAHSPTPAANGLVVYVVCGWQGCAQRLEVDAAVWAAEEARRRPLEAFLRGTWTTTPQTTRGEASPPATDHPTPGAGSTD